LVCCSPEDSTSGRRERALLLGQGGQELIEGASELLDPLALEGLGYVLVVDAGAGELTEQLAGVGKAALEPRVRSPVVVELLGRFPRASC